MGNTSISQNKREYTCCCFWIASKILLVVSNPNEVDGATFAKCWKKKNKKYIFLFVHSSCAMSTEEEEETIVKTVQDAPKPLITRGLIIGIVLVVSLIVVFVTVGIVGAKAQADADKKKAEEEAARKAADEAEKERKKKEEEEKKAEEEAKKKQDELNKKPAELEWIGSETYCTVNGANDLGIISSTWIDASPGHWDNMRMVFRVENGKSIESVLPPGWIYSPNRELALVLDIDDPGMATGITNLLKTRFPGGIGGKTISPQAYVIQEWTLKLEGDQIVLRAPYPLSVLAGGLGLQQPTVLFVANNIRNK